MSEGEPAKPHSGRFKDNGSLEACRDCSGAKCCGNIKVGGTIEPPFLTSHDVSRISSKTGLSPDSFSYEVLNSETGNKVRFLKINSTEGCHFLAGGRCSIHVFRPIDCRLFPLDVKKIGDELKWVIYNYVHCGLTERDYNLLMEQIDTATDIIGGEMLDYATVPTPGMAQMGYRVLTFNASYAGTGKRSATA